VHILKKGFVIKGVKRNNTQSLSYFNELGNVVKSAMHPSKGTYGIITAILTVLRTKHVVISSDTSSEKSKFTNKNHTGSLKGTIGVREN